MITKCLWCNIEIEMADDCRWYDELLWSFVCPESEKIQPGQHIDYGNDNQHSIDDMGYPHVPNMDALSLLAIKASRKEVLNARLRASQGTV